MVYKRAQQLHTIQEVMVFVRDLIGTFHGLLRTFNAEEKCHWPKHINHLVMSYNAMPNQSTGFQPYQLMFGRKAQMPCDTWLGLHQYDDEVSKSKCIWVKDHEELVKATNKRALKSIVKHAGDRVEQAGGEKIYIFLREMLCCCKIIQKEEIKYKMVINLKCARWLSDLLTQIMCILSFL